MSRLCPECFELWARKEAFKASLRLWAGFRARGGRLLHCVVSIPFDGHDEGHYRAMARRVSALHGIVGGISICHPFRDDGDGYVPDGFIHYHIVGIAPGNVLPGGTDGAVVFKVIRDPVRNDYRGLFRLKEARRLLQYLLSHCGIIEGRHPLTWWGCVSYSTFPTSELRAMIPNYDALLDIRARCPFCGARGVVPCDVYDWTAGFTVQAYPYPSEPPGVV